MNSLLVFLNGVALLMLIITLVQRRRRRLDCILIDLYLSQHETYGLDLVKRHPQLLRRGQIYRDLWSLERDGLVCNRPSHEARRWNDCGPRRLFRLTAAGERVAHRLVNAKNQ